MPRPAFSSCQVLYHDDKVLVVNKPAGVPVHGSPMLEGRPPTVLAMARVFTGQVVHAAHRLDRPVSGALVLAFDRDTLATLSRFFELQEVKKKYLAVARGWTAEAGLIDHPLRPPRDERRDKDEAREALTRFRRLATVELPYAVPPYQSARYSLVELEPKTGRRHQLRRHMKHISHHLVGDTSYGKGEHNRLFRERLGCERLLLHSRSISFRHPVNGQEVSVTAPLDDAFEGVAELFRRNSAPAAS